MKNKIRKIKTIEMEVALANYFNFRQNLIVPNVSWGLYLNNSTLHECDLLVLTKSNYLWEVEIKVSKSDLIADKKKTHGHINKNIKRLYFAIPEYLKDSIEHIPKRAGIITVSKNLRCSTIRAPRTDKGYKLKEHEKLKMAMLGSMRIWGLKKKVIKLTV